MTLRYETRRMSLGVSPRWAIYDTETGQTVSEMGSWSWATTLAGQKNIEDKGKKGPEPQIAAPCCDHSEKAERYRQALAQIARRTDCEYAARIADEALAGAGSNG